MDLMKLFKDEALIEILEWGSLFITNDEEGTRVFITPSDRLCVNKMHMETLLDLFADYQIELLLIDDPVFRITDYEG